MKIWEVVVRDASDCYYEGDYPEILTFLFKSEMKARQFCKEKLYKQYISVELQEKELIL